MCFLIMSQKSTFEFWTRSTKNHYCQTFQQKLQLQNQKLLFGHATACHLAITTILSLKGPVRLALFLTSDGPARRCRLCRASSDESWAARASRKRHTPSTSVALGQSRPTPGSCLAPTSPTSSTETGARTPERCPWPASRWLGFCRTGS